MTMDDDLEERRRRCEMICQNDEDIADCVEYSRLEKWELLGDFVQPEKE